MDSNDVLTGLIGKTLPFMRVLILIEFFDYVE